MVISKFLRSPSAEKQDQLVFQLQKQASELYYDRMMYDINDSLTSILAVCDVEGKEGIPKVKQYIHRINQSLNATKNYQNASSSSDQKFNVSLVVKNLMRVIEEQYKEVKIAALLADINAPVLGDQSYFEKLFLHLFVQMFSVGHNTESELLIELRQKDQDAMITILKDQHAFTEQGLERIRGIQENDGFKGKVQITPQGRGVEVIIRIPLQFQLVNLQKMPSNNSRKTESAQKERVREKKPEPVGTWQTGEVNFRPGYAF